MKVFKDVVECHLRRFEVGEVLRMLVVVTVAVMCIGRRAAMADWRTWWPD